MLPSQNNFRRHFPVLNDLLNHGVRKLSSLGCWRTCHLSRVGHTIFAIRQASSILDFLDQLFHSHSIYVSTARLIVQPHLPRDHNVFNLLSQSRYRSGRHSR